MKENLEKIKRDYGDEVFYVAGDAVLKLVMKRGNDFCKDFTKRIFESGSDELVKTFWEGLESFYNQYLLERGPYRTANDIGATMQKAIVDKIMEKAYEDTYKKITSMHLKDKAKEDWMDLKEPMQTEDHIGR